MTERQNDRKTDRLKTVYPPKLHLRGGGGGGGGGYNHINDITASLTICMFNAFWAYGLCRIYNAWSFCCFLGGNQMLSENSILHQMFKC